MKRILKWLLIACGVLVALAALLYLVGALLPSSYSFTRSIRLKQTPDAVFSLLADVAHFPEWIGDVEKVEMLPPLAGQEVARQTFKGGMVMSIVTSESIRPGKLVRMMSDANGPFSGSWSYEISAADGGSKVALTERGEFRSPPFRVIARAFGPTKYVDKHLRDIARKFGETAVIE